MSSDSVTWIQLVELLNSRERGETEFTLIDIREEYELFHGYIPGAVNMPLSTFDPETLNRLVAAEVISGEVIVYCQAGVRSEHLLHELTEQGILGVKHYGGGYIDWVNQAARGV